MDVIKKYWGSAYVYVLLATPCTCMLAGTFWTVCKLAGLYPDLAWYYIVLFDLSQIIYLSIAIYFIHQVRRNTTYLFKHLGRLKAFVVIILFIQYNFILYLFPSYYVWDCTFIFLAILAFLFDSKLLLGNIAAYSIALFIAHARFPEKFLPLEDAKLVEIIAYRAVCMVITSACIYLIAWFAERFLIQAQERNRENIHLLNKQVKYYREVELLDKEIRRFRHDIKEHFISMEALMESGQEEKLRNYFQELKSGFSSGERMYFSGNEIVDAIMNCELIRDCKEDVDIMVYGELPQMHTISDIDLCTLFSNLLSNAIKAANHCSESMKAELMVRFSTGKQYFSITVMNTAQEEFDIKKVKSIQTDKDHGFGVRKVLEIVEKYDGNIEQTMGNNKVEITIYLPI